MPNDKKQALRQYAAPVVASPENPTVEEMTLLGEARSEGLPGMIAVAEVLRNRAKYRGITPEAAALQPKQFSFWNDGLQKGMKTAYENEDMWPLARQAWQQSEHSNTVQGADMYHANYVKPSWDMKKVRKIATPKVGGKHIFYREIK